MKSEWSSWLRRTAKHLALTPVHPQWLTFRSKRRAVQFIRRDASGLLLDVGSGDGALRASLASKSAYLSVDYPVTLHGGYVGRPDVLADAASLPFPDCSVDRVAILDVLEHVRDPRVVLAEAARVLRPGGKLYVHVPCLYPLHDEPHDFFRPTRHWLQTAIGGAALEVRCIEARGRPFETAALLFNIAVAQVLRRAIDRFPPSLVLATVCVPVFLFVNLAGWLASALVEKEESMPFAYWVVADRPSAETVQASE